ncbi:hypothetical protein [Qipengyuania sp. JC766]|uniref:hypothetical protein n=1 Tax=Qipengyuania sp. JC766 TaxID=3232139 RepID=UPI00345833B8
MLLSVAFSFLLVASASTQDGDSQEAIEKTEKTREKEEVSSSDKQKIRCRTERLVNSRIPQKICRTEAEWEEIERQNREQHENSRRSGGNRAESGTIYGGD